MNYLWIDKTSSVIVVNFISWLFEKPYFAFVLGFAFNLERVLKFTLHQMWLRALIHRRFNVVKSQLLLFTILHWLFTTLRIFIHRHFRHVSWRVKSVFILCTYWNQLLFSLISLPYCLANSKCPFSPHSFIIKSVTYIIDTQYIIPQKYAFPLYYRWKSVTGQLWVRYESVTEDLIHKK